MDLSGISKASSPIPYTRDLQGGSSSADVDSVILGRKEIADPDIEKMKKMAHLSADAIGERVGLQTSKHNHLLVEQQLDFCIAHGKKVFEIFFDGFKPTDLKPDLRKKIKETAFANGITLQVHAPIEEAKDRKKVLRETLAFCEDVGSRVLTVHPHRKEIPLYKKIFREAQQKEISIGLENYKEGDTYYTPGEFVDFCNKFSGFPNVGITFDVGHANIGQDVIAFLEAIPAERIINIHLHDNAGREDSHLPIGRGKIDFPELVRHLKEKNYKGNFIIERWETGLESAEYFPRLWQEAKGVN